MLDQVSSSLFNMRDLVFYFKIRGVGSNDYRNRH
jgi:hypothetical protein